MEVRIKRGVLQIRHAIARAHKHATAADRVLSLVEGAVST